ncbi:hypothetical protein BJV74DRAFT_928415 [Russula compacta]|nr:hypothetical protein BJV74DRAFT_928415 [Russula compacta]
MIRPGIIRSRPNAKGRRGRHSTDAPDSQAEYASSSSTNNSRIGTGQDIIITDEREDESVAIDSSPGPSHAPAPADSTPPPPQDLGEQQLEDWRRHSVMSSTHTKTSIRSTTYRVEGPQRSWDDVQTSRNRKWWCVDLPGYGPTETPMGGDEDEEEDNDNDMDMDKDECNEEGWRS